MKRTIPFLIVLALVCGGTHNVLAQNTNTTNQQKQSGVVDDAGATKVIDDTGATKKCSGANCTSTTASGFTLPIRLKNPLKVDNITDAVKLFMNIVLKIALPFIILFFMWAGLQYILALGKPEKIKEAHKMFRYTIIGTLLILGAWTITNAIIGTINSIVG